jgi:hypothetical protein
MQGNNEFHSYLTVNINKSGYVLNSALELDLSDASNWDDTTTTDWTVASNRAGKDFYVYACTPASGTDPDFILSANSTIPVCGVEMQKAMQEWLDKRMGEYAPEVTDVSEDKGPGKTKTFIISTTEKAEEI